MARLALTNDAGQADPSQYITAYNSSCMFAAATAAAAVTEDGRLKIDLGKR
jgi:hypothetical protein